MYSIRRLVEVAKTAIPFQVIVKAIDGYKRDDYPLIFRWSFQVTAIRELFSFAHVIDTDEAIISWNKDISS